MCLLTLICLHKSLGAVYGTRSLLVCKLNRKPSFEQIFYSSTESASFDEQSRLH